MIILTFEKMNREYACVLVVKECMCVCVCVLVVKGCMCVCFSGERVYVYVF